MGYLPIVNTQLVELIVPLANATSQRFNIIDQPQLRNKYCDWIETFNITDISKTPTGNPLISETVMAYSFITFYVTNPATKLKGEYLNQVPLRSLHRTQSGTNGWVRDVLYLNGMFIDWSKTYVTTGVAIGIGAQTSFLFNVAYRDTPGGMIRS